jgi:hypothetical protein
VDAPLDASGNSGYVGMQSEAVIYLEAIGQPQNFGVQTIMPA